MANLPDNYADITLRLRDALGLKVLVETGSFGGLSAAWAAERFDHVISIDIRAENQVLAKERCSGKENVEWIVGDSRTALQPVIDSLDGPTFFWLDAHEESGKFGCDHDDCPVLEELAAIAASPYRHAILIDDAHCFAEPYDPVVWPRVGTIGAHAEAAGYRMQKVGYGLLLVSAEVEG